jgi:hypothetical protein
MAGKRKSTTDSGKKDNKSEFVRSHSNLAPAQIVEKAKAAGLDLSVSYVYNVRGQQKAKAKKAGRSAKAKSPVLQHLDHVRALRTVILHVGIERAKQMMDQIVTDLSI